MDLHLPIMVTIIFEVSGSSMFKLFEWKERCVALHAVIKSINPFIAEPIYK
jgi:hypothetical protein